MPLSREIERLRAEHAALIALARIVTELLQSPGPPQLTELALARGRLRETLVRHLKCEDWILYPRLMATGEPELMDITREFELEMGDLAAEYVAYDDKWTAERVAAKLTEFSRETIEIFGILATRVEREERELYPLADKLYAAASALGPAITDEATISS
jgi:hemerythrin-like domain-containing protein